MKKRRYLTATQILSSEGRMTRNKVLVFEDALLVDIQPEVNIDPINIERFEGTLIPGFVNAHCHLELSHMKGRIQAGTGLTSFLHEVVTQEPIPEEVILEHIKQGDQEMWEAGIVAVGDISNLPYTAETKARSRIRYYTFVEMFDFLDPCKCDSFYYQYESVYKVFLEFGLNHVTRVPHSTYTVSRKMMGKLSETLVPAEVGSIHMLENKQENYLMESRDSEYYQFFAELGYPLSHFLPPGHGSLEEFLESEYHPDRMVFVHNTVAGKDDLEKLMRYEGAFLVTCANANRYIESRLPDYSLWRHSGMPICIGTDSYASNYQLSVWDEICTIKSFHPNIPWEELIRWGTLNGACALGMEDELGSFEIGKSPGVVCLRHDNRDLVSTTSKAERII